MKHVYQGRLAWVQHVLGLGLLIGLGALGGVAQAQIEFSDQSATDGLPFVGESYGASWGDFIGDGRPDLYLNHHRLQGGIYRNNGSSGSTKFTDVTLQLDSSDDWVPYPWGVDKHGGSFADFDKDGDLDFYSTLSAGGPAGTDADLFVNEGGLFVERASQFGVTSDSSGRQPVWFDYNYDGRIDLAVVNVSAGGKLFRQSTSGTSFSQRASNDGYTCTKMFMQQLADLNVDGRLDVICVSQSGGIYPSWILSTASVPFPDITALVPATSTTADAAVADFDNDGRVDVFIVKGKLHVNEALQIAPNRAEAHLHISPPTAEGGFGFASTGPITVTLHAPFILANEIRIGAAGTNPAAKTFTLDPTNPAHQGIIANRSSQGLYVGFNISTNRWEFWTASGGLIDTPSYIEAVGAAGVTLSGVSAAAGTIKGGDLPMVPRLWMNTVASGFKDETFVRGLGAAIHCSTVVAADFDNDMDQDLYLGCRGGVQNKPNIMYENVGGGVFEPLVPLGQGWSGQGAVGQGLESKTGATESVVVADYDVDGRVDLALTNGNRLVPERMGGPDELLRNTTSNSNNWIELDLVGTVSNRDAVGTKVTVIASGATQTRWQDGKYHRWSQSDKRIHTGLGGNIQANTIQVNWPNGFVDTFSNVQANALYRVTEGNASNTGTIAAVTLGPVPALPAPQPGNECGVPVYQASIHTGVFLYKNCSTGLWSMRVTAGGATSTVLFSGNLTSDQAFTNVAGFNLEAADVFDNLTATVIQFGFNTSFANIDGVDFTVPAGADACLNLDLPANVPVMVGPDRKTAPMPFNVTTFQTCSAPPPPPPECGVPAIQNSVDKAIFLYRDCSAPNGIWTVRATSGGSATAVTYNGSVSSAQTFTDVSTFSFESGDSLNDSGNQLSYTLLMAMNGIDGFSFRTASENVADNNCFTVSNLPAGAQVLIGPNRETAPPTPFNLNTFGACN